MEKSSNAFQSNNGTQRTRYFNVNTTASVIFVIVIIIIFRLAWIQSFPASYSYEVYAFVQFAHDQIFKNFSFQPYHGFYHTLWGYLIAVLYASGFEAIDALRVACAVFASFTVLIIFGVARIAFGDVSALFAASFAASSFWFIWASRSGWQKFLIIIAQGLLIYGLVFSIKRAPWLGGLISAAGLVWGAYAYWGFYITPPIIFAFVLISWLYSPVLRQRLSIWTAVTTVIGLFGITPLIIFFFNFPELVTYPTEKILSSHNGDKYQQYYENVRFYLWGFSGLPNARENVHVGYVDFLPFITLPVAILLLLGIVRLAALCISSWLHLLLIVVFFAHLLLVPLAGAENQYAISLFIWVMLASAIGAEYLVTLIKAHLIGGRQVSITSVFLIIGCTAYLDYMEAFHSRRVFHFEGDTSLTVLQHLEDRSGTHPIFAPIGHRTSHIANTLTELRDFGLNGLQAASRLLNLERSGFVLPHSKLALSHDLEIILPVHDGFAKDFIESITRLYPLIEVSSLTYSAPQIWQDESPIGISVRVPAEARQSIAGLRLSNIDDRCGFEFSGYLYSDKSTVASIEYPAGMTSSFSLNGSGSQSLKYCINCSLVDSMPLEEGLTAYRTCSFSLVSLPRIHFDHTTLNTDLNENSVSFPTPLTREGIMVNKPARYSPFYFEITAVFSLVNGAIDCLMRENGEMLLLERGAVIRRDAKGDFVPLHRFNFKHPPKILRKFLSYLVVYNPHDGALFLSLDQSPIIKKAECYSSEIDCNDQMGCVGVC